MPQKPETELAEYRARMRYRYGEPTVAGAARALRAGICYGVLYWLAAGVVPVLAIVLSSVEILAIGALLTLGALRGYLDAARAYNWHTRRLY